MSDFPTDRGMDFARGGVISVGSMLAVLSIPTVASTAWPSANLGIFVPIRIPMPVTVYKLAIGAGNTAAGNFDVGIYDAGGNAMVRAGATAKGADTEQILDITDTVIGPGVYYLGMAADGTNNYTMTTPPGVSPIPLQKTRLAGVVHAASAYSAGLVSAVTYTAATLAPIPLIAAYLRPY